MLRQDGGDRHRQSVNGYQTCCILCPCYGCCPRRKAMLRCRRKQKDILQ